MGPLPARKHDADASRAAILEAAEALFVARGFSAISLSEIAERSGVTKSLIHHHFGAKEALWAEVKRRRFTSYHAQQIALAQRMNIVRADVPASHVLMVFLALVHAYFEEGQFVAVDKPVDPDAYLATAWSTFAAAMLVNPS